MDPLLLCHSVLSHTSRAQCPLVHVLGQVGAWHSGVAAVQVVQVLHCHLLSHTPSVESSSVEMWCVLTLLCALGHPCRCSLEICVLTSFVNEGWEPQCRVLMMWRAAQLALWELLSTEVTMLNSINPLDIYRDVAGIGTLLRAVLCACILLQ